MDIMKMLYDRNRFQEIYGLSKQEEGREEGRNEAGETIYQRAISEFGMSEEKARILAFGA